MIKGIGIDLLDSSRIKKALMNSKFSEKYYTLAERELAQKYSWRKLANNFVAKEAVAKAFGLGFRKFGLKDIEVLRNCYGKPYVKLHGNAKKIARRFRYRKIHISITDTKDSIMAIAIIE